MHFVPALMPLAKATKWRSHEGKKQNFIAFHMRLTLCTLDAWVSALGYLDNLCSGI